MTAALLTSSTVLRLPAARYKNLLQAADAAIAT
jgi:hypothetical protein